MSLIPMSYDEKSVKSPVIALSVLKAAVLSGKMVSSGWPSKVSPRLFSGMSYCKSMLLGRKASYILSIGWEGCLLGF